VKNKEVPSEIKELLKAAQKINNLYPAGLFDAKLLQKAKIKYPELYKEYCDYFLDVYKYILGNQKKLNRIKRIGTKFWDTLAD
jgi:hypothetical protein